MHGYNNGACLPPPRRAGLIKTHTHTHTHPPPPTRTGPEQQRHALRLPPHPCRPVPGAGRQGPQRVSAGLSLLSLMAVCCLSFVCVSVCVYMRNPHDLDRRRHPSKTDHPHNNHHHNNIINVEIHARSSSGPGGGPPAWSSTPSWGGFGAGEFFFSLNCHT